ncbi:MAG: DNA gyrase inhibitor YacG [Hydrogenophaga sp.]|jgi:uncharacterized protein|uniref:DNA gyrase inhibitor YacG n=1 Tax=Hydrogenophaga intermedia TaxID=65786 RepID=UPI002043907C|nr:DNA gyrase inhibitor YacG [Hydrogenophaga intermedia]MCM3563969.1 DNA gyrase inhibitor YacG [Hydrogenophaga intermedia]
MSATNPERVVRCPACGGDSVYAPSNRWRPFCSERCRQQDLGAWASEQYAVPEQENQSDPDFEKS